MYRILLAFLAIILACSVSEALLDGKTQQKVNGICKQTPDTRFCSSVFAKSMIPSSPSNKDLMNMTVRQAERFSANTNFFISTLLRNAGDEKPDLQMCAEAYTFVDMAFTNAVSYFDQGLYSNILKLQKKVSRGVSICKTDFIVPGYKINPLIEKNRETMVFMAMEKIVSRMVAS